MLYSMSKPVAEVAIATFNFSLNSSLVSYTGKSKRLKQVLKGGGREGGREGGVHKTEDDASN
jgi:hypothetical protein